MSDTKCRRCKLCGTNTREIKHLIVLAVGGHMHIWKT